MSTWFRYTINNLLTIWHHIARCVQREKSIGESFILGKIFLPRNPNLQEQHFQTRLKLKDLYPRKLLKMRKLFFLLYDCCLFLKVKIVKVVAIISFLMPPYVKNNNIRLRLILNLYLTVLNSLNIICFLRQIY